MSDKKKVIMTIGNCRIKDYDTHNVMVERYENVFIPQNKETVQKWVFKGYCASMLKALLFIQRNELLIDRKEIKDLDGFIQHVKKSNAQLMDVVRE
ncbi:hypothetical protein [Gracilibacillus alcaliphilus]|uniref:hypothetical protein n=1 Tax=Gracilibacillus alcaliphilus TaxID=1401441 RepID=UPI00195784AF|nr:hypothetical protein [Gracilibacillus alcaliphilus]MBM7679549.1 hypothetical protein [Gracilibacillus alcaliphilus]